MFIAVDEVPIFPVQLPCGVIRKLQFLATECWKLNNSPRELFGDSVYQLKHTNGQVDPLFFYDALDGKGGTL